VREIPTTTGLDIAVIGPPGAGKGTHARELSGQFGLVPLSTGDLFRRALETGSSLGRRARWYMERGELVPDELVEELLEERIGNLPADQGALFDGFPRTEYQGRLLDDLLGSLQRRLVLVVHLDIDDELAVERLSGRLVCRSCDATYNQQSRPPAAAGRCDRCGGELFRRTDDEPDIARRRLRTYRRTTGEVLDYYDGSGRCASVKADRSVQDVIVELAGLVDATVRGEAVEESYRPDMSWLRGAGIATAPTVVRQTLDWVVLGGPGSGKGTQAVTLSTSLGVPHISTGDLFRENLKARTDLGQLAQSYMDRGELVPDEVTEAMVRARLEHPDAIDGFLLDGFPRTLTQAEALDEMLVDSGRRLVAAVHIKVSDAEIVRRLSGRLVCRDCGTSFHVEFKPPLLASVCDVCGGQLYRRDDDTPETIKARLRTFHGNEQPLLEYYRRQSVLHDIDGEGPPEQVTSRALATAAALIPRPAETRAGK
jgi:adenylate kinase